MNIRTFLGGLSLSLAFSTTYAETIIPADVMDFAQLGMPYNTHTKNIHNFICVNASIDELSGAPNASFNFEHNMSYQKTLEALTGGLSVGVDYPLVKLNAGANIADEFMTDEYSSSWTATAIAVPDVIRLNPGSHGYQLSDKCEEYSTNYASDSENLIKKAGNEFITQINRGASLLIQMRMKFANRHQKDAWDAQAKYSSIGTWKLQIEGYLEDLSEEEKQSISIEIKAYQSGGEAASLAAVLPNNAMSCSTSDIEACEMAFEDALIYASNFGSQLAEGSNYNVLSFTTSSYSESGLYQLVAPDSDLEPINEVYLDQLNSLFKQQLDDRGRSIEMLGLYSRYLENEWLDELEKIKSKTDQNAYVISKVADICFRYPYGGECETQYDALVNDPNKLIKEYDRNYLYFPAPKISLSSRFNLLQEFEGTQSMFGSNASKFQLEVNSDYVIDDVSTDEFTLGVQYSHDCKLYVEDSDGLEYLANYPESGTYDLSNIYNERLENYLFSINNSRFNGKLVCKGLGGDVEILIPMKANLPSSTIRIESSSEVVYFEGEKNKYIPNEKSFDLNLNSLSDIKMGETQNLSFNSEFSRVCNIYVKEISESDPQHTFSSDSVVDVNLFLDDELYIYLLSNNQQKFNLLTSCDGLGGDVTVELTLSAVIEELKDTDGDGLKDIEEINTYGTDPLKYDTDGDGLSDKAELPYCYDPEDEGRCQENRHYPTNPLLYDTDGDGLNDYEDQYTHPTRPDRSDSDFDGLNDYQEVIIYGTDPNNSDTDGDKSDDAEEINNGTNPLVPDVLFIDAKNDYIDEYFISTRYCTNEIRTVRVYPLNNDIGDNLRIASVSSLSSSIKSASISSDKKSINVIVKGNYCYFDLSYSVTNGQASDSARVYWQISDWD